MSDNEQIIADISLIVLAINTLLYLFGLYTNRSNKYKIFTFYLACIALIQMRASYLAFYKLNNLYLSHVYFVSQFVLLSLFFRSLLLSKQKKVLDAISLIVIIVLIALYGLNFTGYYDLKPFNPLEVFVCSLPIIIYAILHLYNSLSERLNFVYITSGLLLYLIVSTLLFTLGNVLNDNDDFSYVSLILWKMNSVFYIIYQILIGFEWFKNFRQKKVV